MRLNLPVAAHVPVLRLARACLVFVVLAPWLAAGCAQPAVTGVTTVYVVRHAEKKLDNDDPDLTEAGQQRARALAHTLRSEPLDAIFSTDTRRTRQTATPAAEARGLQVRLYGKEDITRVIMHVRRAPGRYLVIGHSNTVPDLVSRLGGEPGAAIDEASEFDRLYVLVLHPDGSVVTLLLRYGAPAPAQP
jgi:broad specificity phosphatase PhoE